MYISSLEINDFRNIVSEKVEPSENINILFGDNANGKTSFIESIYFVANLKSFRTNNLKDCLRFDSKELNIKCEYNKNNCKETVSVCLNNREKKFLKNKKVTKIEDYLWSMATIVFQPDDILIVNGSPSLRRYLIDRSIFYTNIDHFQNLLKLNKALKNKNSCLKNGNLNCIDDWNRIIAKYSYLIIEKRNKYVRKINKIILSKSDYFYSLKIDDYCSDDISENSILDCINSNIDSEIKYKSSIIGAHRQSFNFILDGKYLKSFGSQGQKRTCILLFKSSQIDDFFSINGFYPILLLDDMASELDSKNRNIIIDLIDNFSGQTFITTTDKNFLNIKNSSKIFKVDDGKLSHYLEQGE